MGLLFGLFATFASQPGLAEEYLSREQAIKQLLAEADRISQQRLLLNDATLAEIKKEVPLWSERLYEVHVGYKGVQPELYLIIDNAVGKTLPFTYALVVGKDFKIRQIEVMAYRESHGGEIRNLPFRQQFYGKGATDALRLNQDIKNIAGATLSCRSLVDGVRNHVKVLKLIAGMIPLSNSSEKIQPSAPTPPASLPAKKAAIKNERHQSSEIKLVTRSTILMDTLLEVQVAFDSGHSSKEVAVTAIESAIGRIEEIENNISTWQQNSPAWRFNAGSENVWFNAGDDLWQLIFHSKRLWQKTEGGFDIATAPLSQAWRLGEKNQQTPTADQLLFLRRQSTMSDVVMGEKPFVKKLNAGAKIDFGAIAKGYALDQARAILRNAGVEDFLINFGGQIVARGNQPGSSQGWLVFINAPQQSQTQKTTNVQSGGYLAKVTLKNQSLSVTADDQRGRIINGKLYSHIISPLDGMPVNDKKMVAVIHDDALEADAFSTGVFAMPWHLAVKMGKKNNISVLMMGMNNSHFESKSWQAIASFLPSINVSKQQTDGKHARI